MAFNALAYAQELENTGFPQAQARAEAQALHRAEARELRSEIGELRSELHNEVGALRQEMMQLNSKLTSQMAQLETRLTRWMLIAAGFGGGIAEGLAILSTFIPSTCP